MSRRIAIVEDEAAIRENYAAVLRRQGYQVATYANRREAMSGFEQRLPDLAIIDIGLQDEIDGGFLLCQSLRGMSPTLPIIFLTARDSDLDTVSGLRMGADDYLTKDISMPHMTARISALFRRMEAFSQPDDKQQQVQCGSLSLDLNRMQARWKELAVDLTVTEFWMVHALARFAGHVKSRQHLMQDARVVVDDSTITSHIKRIRKKFVQLDEAFDCIDTVYGMGYRWTSDRD
ncbi:proteobacterial dedicated sortase system response regulator [Bowmanella denitrificans]|uniref:proteobacterial dedicated sortase system response regulator n=1 Tax=Bowmanella denitrificans TaxID=366582 RepID=UPI000C9C5DAD|nr:proteobacterial dedicated sortase system response regulator [Bowmanella denitrificans]